MKYFDRKIEFAKDRARQKRVLSKVPKKSKLETILKRIIKQNFNKKTKSKIEALEEFYNYSKDKYKFSLNHILAYANRINHDSMDRLNHLESILDCEDVKKIILRSSFDILSISPQRIDDLCDYLINYGVDSKKALFIVKKNPVLLNLKLESLDEKIKFLEDQGHSKEQVKKLITRTPAILNYSTDRVNQLYSLLEEKGHSKNKRCKIVEINPRMLTCSIDRIREIYDYFSSLGYNFEQVKKIIEINRGLLSSKKSTIESNVNNLYRLFQNDAQSIILNYSSAILLKQSNVESKVKYLLKKGHGSSFIKKMIEKYPRILGYTLNRLEETYKTVQDFGFTKQGTLRIISKDPYLFSVNPGRLKSEFDKCQELLSYDILITMFEKYPQCITMGYSRIVQTYKTLIDQGHSEDAARKILEEVPSLVCSKISEVKKAYLILKKRFNNFLEIIDEIPAILITSKKQLEQLSDDKLYQYAMHIDYKIHRKGDTTISDTNLNYLKIDNKII